MGLFPVHVLGLLITVSGALGHLAGGAKGTLDTLDRATAQVSVAALVTGIVADGAYGEERALSGGRRLLRSGRHEKRKQKKSSHKGSKGHSEKKQRGRHHGKLKSIKPQKLEKEEVEKSRDAAREFLEGADENPEKRGLLEGAQEGAEEVSSAGEQEMPAAGEGDEAVGAAAGEGGGGGEALKADGGGEKAAGEREEGAEEGGRGEGGGGSDEGGRKEGEEEGGGKEEGGEGGMEGGEGEVAGASERGEGEEGREKEEGGSKEAGKVEEGGEEQAAAAKEEEGAEQGSRERAEQAREGEAEKGGEGTKMQAGKKEGGREAGEGESDENADGVKEGSKEGESGMGQLMQGRSGADVPHSELARDPLIAAGLNPEIIDPGVLTMQAQTTEDSGNSGVADEIAMSSALMEGPTEVAQAADLRPLTEEDLEALRKAEQDVAVEISPKELLEIEKVVHEEEEQYASVMQEVMGIKSRLNPTLAALKDKTKKHLLPRLVSLAKSTRSAFAHTSRSISGRFQPYVGSKLSAFLATLLSYTLLFLPMVLVGYLVNQVRVVLTVRKAVLLANLYLSIYCFTLFAADLLISAEPMSSLKIVAEPNFYLLQILQCIGYLLYLLLQVTHLLWVARTREREMKFALLKGLFQVAASVFIGLHYYVTVFEPAMMDQSPNTGAGAYALYCVGFVVLTLFSQAERKEDKQI